MGDHGDILKLLAPSVGAPYLKRLHRARRRAQQKAINNGDPLYTQELADLRALRPEVNKYSKEARKGLE